jgi:hypothetical protein
VAFCEKRYIPKAVLPGGIQSWHNLVGLGDRKNRWNPLGQLKDKGLIELDVFDSNAAENVVRIIEDSTDETVGLHHLAIMVNSGYQIDFFMSFPLNTNLYDLVGGLTALLSVSNIADRLAVVIPKCPLPLKLSITNQLPFYSRWDSLPQCVYLLKLYLYASFTDFNLKLIEGVSSQGSRGE